jgi:hypothetical protein
VVGCYPLALCEVRRRAEADVRSPPSSFLQKVRCKGMGFRQRGPFSPCAAMPARDIATSLFFAKVLGSSND